MGATRGQVLSGEPCTRAPRARRPASIGLLTGALTVALVVTGCSGGRPASSGQGDQGGGSSTAAVATDGFDVGGGRPPGQDAARIRFYREVITDPSAGGAEAIVFLLPEGWSYQGSVQWLPQWARVAFLQTTMTDPASGLTIDWLPIQDFMFFQPPAGFTVPIGGNYQGHEYLAPITDPAQFVAQFWAPTTLPELQAAQLVNVTQVPAIAADFKTQFGGPADAGAYRLRYEFQRDGRTWEEDISFALLFSGSADLTSWYVNFAYTVRAPKGEIDRQAGVISTIVASRATTPAWEATYRVVRQLFTQGIQQQMADTQAFGQALAQHRAEIAALQAQVTQEREASQDRIADLRGESLQGVQSYSDPVNGGFVQLPVGWNEYWVNEKGEYLTSAQAGFDPNTLNDGTWQRLQPRP